MDLKYLYVYNTYVKETSYFGISFEKSIFPMPATKLFKKFRIFISEYDYNDFYLKLYVNLNLKINFSANFIIENIGFAKFKYSYDEYLDLPNSPNIRYFLISLRPTLMANIERLFYERINPEINKTLKELYCKICVPHDATINRRKQSYKKTKRINIYVDYVKNQMNKYTIRIYVSFRQNSHLRRIHHEYVNGNVNELSFLRIFYELMLPVRKRATFNTREKYVSDDTNIPTTGDIYFEVYLEYIIHFIKMISSDD
jgi:hypothetical protein